MLIIDCAGVCLCVICVCVCVCMLFSSGFSVEETLRSGFVMTFEGLKKTEWV